MATGPGRPLRGGAPARPRSACAVARPLASWATRRHEARAHRRARAIRRARQPTARRPDTLAGREVLGVPVEVSECRDGPVGRGVAEPSGGPDRGRPGVVGSATASSVAVRIGLPVGRAHLGGRLARSGVLALVVLDDPLEPVVGIEAARRASAGPGSTGCRGRGRRPRRRRGARPRAPAPRGSCRGSRRRRGRSGCSGSTAAAAWSSIAAGGRRAAARARGRGRG